MQLLWWSCQYSYNGHSKLCFTLQIQSAAICKNLVKIFALESANGHHHEYFYEIWTSRSSNDKVWEKS